MFGNTIKWITLSLLIPKDRFPFLTSIGFSIKKEISPDFHVMMVLLNVTQNSKAAKIPFLHFQ